MPDHVHIKLLGKNWENFDGKFQRIRRILRIFLLSDYDQFWSLENSFNGVNLIWMEDRKNHLSL